MAVAFAGIIFDYDYIVFVAVDVVVLAGYVVLFVVVAVDDAGALAAAHVDYIFVWIKIATFFKIATLLIASDED